ncbi:UDP-4-amino-4, 6-dideoxy-N-acetyl-beta-L-altrosamine transaminase [Azospirillaceae bacterium]
MNKSRFLPYGRQSIDESDIASVVEVLRGDWLTQGPAVEAFERELATRTGAVYAAACSNGTSALHLAALALDIQPGDGVIVPSITFLATANAVRYVGAEVIFADINPNTGLIGVPQIEEALVRARKNGIQARAIFPVHFAGQSANMIEIGAFAREHRLKIVEDSSHAIGTSVAHEDKWLSLGALPYSDMATFSFHPVKTVAAGEGGAVVTNDPTLIEKLRRFRNHGMTKEPSDFENLGMGFNTDAMLNPWYYEMPEIGYNYRMTDIQCALGLSQLKRLDHFVEQRQALVTRYETLLESLSPRVTPLERVSGCRPAWHLMVVRIDFARSRRSRSGVMFSLRERGIGTQVHYIPVHRQPYYRRRYGDVSLPGTESYYQQTLSLPLFVGMTNEDVERVVDGLTAIVTQ